MKDSANAAFEAGNWEKAAELFGRVLGAEPSNYEALLKYGVASAHLNRVEPAIGALCSVLRQNPVEMDALIWSGIMRHQLGEFDEARSLFELARRIEPSSFAPYVGILRGHKVKSEDREFVASASRVLSEGAREDDETRQLTYAVAKAYDDLGDYETAMEYFDRANGLARRLQMPAGMDRNFHSLKLNEAMRVFSPATLRQGFQFSQSSSKPIFIVGMIRSGTTLVEQIISRHSSVRAGGELRFWIDNGPAVFLPSGVNAELAEFLGLEYLASLGRFAAGDLRVTDKMPLNYMLLGLIHSLFPNAPIVHCRRDPADTCLSIYMTPYAAPPDFAYDRDDIAYAYRDYQRVMRFWKRSLPPGRILDVNYEGLVEEPESSIRRILGYCGLEWDPACLSPEANERVVDTPSKWQVRQPMYRTSVGRARRYAPWLGPLGQLG